MEEGAAKYLDKFKKSELIGFACATKNKRILIMRHVFFLQLSPLQLLSVGMYMENKKTFLASSLSFPYKS